MTPTTPAAVSASALRNARAAALHADRVIAAINLLRAQPYTATRLAGVLGVTTMTAHNLIGKLPERGFQLLTEPVRQGRRGPAASAYRIVAAR